MKLRFLCILCCFFAGCSKSDPGVSNEVREIKLGDFEGSIRFKTVVVDGNEYYACRSGYYWVLCPKLPPSITTPFKSSLTGTVPIESVLGGASSPGVLRFHQN